MSDDGGIQYYQTLGQYEEYETWKADQKAQQEYLEYLDSLEQEQYHEME